MMGLLEDYNRKIILDYGCGPGYDIVRFATHSDPFKIYGADISKKALGYAEEHIKLVSKDNICKFLDLNNNELADLGENTIDHIHCGGVLHHTPDPQAILNNFYSLLKKNGTATVMVYNKESIWYHLYVPYILQIIKGRYKNDSIEEAFRKSTDGPSCPISVAYTQDEFIRMCGGTGFNTEFVGAYFSMYELKLIDKYIDQALTCERLNTKHKEFLEKITRGNDGSYYLKDKQCGISAVYKLRK